MSQFDVHRARGDAAQLAPYLVVLQTNVLADLNVVVVAPMRLATKFGPTVKHLHVKLDFADKAHVLAPEELISLPRKLLGERVGSIVAARQSVLAALDFLFAGF
jgi:toxin CcdB